MTDEEKKAFESVKDMFEDVTIKDIDEQSITIYGVAITFRKGFSNNYYKRRIGKKMEKSNIYILRED